MTKPQVSAILFVRDLDSLVAFYQEVFGVRASHHDTEHARLDFNGFELMIHQIPKHLLNTESNPGPPERRERSAIRLDFPVTDMTYARREAQRLGGIIDELPPKWAGADTSFFLGHDPEGNVFGVATA